jgi:hypothetical protein
MQHLIRLRVPIDNRSKKGLISFALDLKLDCISVLPAGQPSAPALKDLGVQNGDSFTWIVNLPAGE